MMDCSWRAEQCLSLLDVMASEYVLSSFVMLFWTLNSCNDDNIDAVGVFQYWSYMNILSFHCTPTCSEARLILLQWFLCFVFNRLRMMWRITLFRWLSSLMFLSFWLWLWLPFFVSDITSDCVHCCSLLVHCWSFTVSSKELSEPLQFHHLHLSAIRKGRCPLRINCLLYR